MTSQTPQHAHPSNTVSVASALQAAHITPAAPPGALAVPMQSPSNVGSGPHTTARSRRHHKVVIPEGASRHSGVVVSRQDTYGFIKASDHEGRYFFHARDTDGHTSKGALVSFIVGHDSTNNKDVALSVHTVAQPASHEHREVALAGRLKGTVVALPKGPVSMQVDDGMVAYEDEAGEQQQAFFGTCRMQHASEASRLTVGASVEFSLARNTATNTLKATKVRLLDGKLRGEDSTSNETVEGGPSEQHATATDSGVTSTTSTAMPRVESSAPREHGRVTLLKKEFGFIRQVSRPGDLFFHFSQLVGGLTREDVHIGLDVEFTVRRDRGGKLSAVSVGTAPPGSVVFERVSSTVLRGVISSSASIGKDYGGAGVVPGVIEFDALQATVGAAAGDGALEGLVSDPPLGKARIVFYASDLSKSRRGMPKPGDNVTFRVKVDVAAAAASASATNAAAAALAARRAVEVRPVRCAGTVDVVQADRRFGFINYAELDAPHADDPPPPIVAAVEEMPATSAETANATATADDAAGKTEDAADEHSKQDAACKSVGTANEGEEPSTLASALRLLPPQPSARVFFHFSEVGGGVVLKKGDGVEFVLHTNPKNGESVAVKIRRTKEALPSSDREGSRGGGGGAQDGAALPAQNPNKPRLTGNFQSGEHKAQRMPKMPDGSRGFSGSFRMKGLEAMVLVSEQSPGEVDECSKHPFFAGLALRMPKVLSVEAPPFIPATASSGGSLVECG